MINLDMFIENFIPLSSTYLVVRFPLNMENCVDVLTKKAYLEINYSACLREYVENPTYELSSENSTMHYRIMVQ